MKWPQNRLGHILYNRNISCPWSIRNTDWTIPAPWRSVLHSFQGVPRSLFLNVSIDSDSSPYLNTGGPTYTTYISLHGVTSSKTTFINAVVITSSLSRAQRIPAQNMLLAYSVGSSRRRAVFFNVGRRTILPISTKFRHSVSYRAAQGTLHSAFGDERTIPYQVPLMGSQPLCSHSVSSDCTWHRCSRRLLL
jgi:hypothetical protein